MNPVESTLSVSTPASRHLEKFKKYLVKNDFGSCLINLVQSCPTTPNNMVGILYTESFNIFRLMHRKMSSILFVELLLDLRFLCLFLFYVQVNLLDFYKYTVACHQQSLEPQSKSGIQGHVLVFHQFSCTCR